MKLVKLLFVVILALFVTSVTLSNHSLDDSQKTAMLTSQVTVLSHELTILKSQVADASSLTSASEKVEAIGFTETPRIVSLGIGSVVASR